MLTPVQPDVIIKSETHKVARTIDPVRIIAHVVIGMTGFVFFGDSKARVKSSIPAISPNTATNIRNIKICCIFFSSRESLSPSTMMPGILSGNLYATYYHFQSVLTIVFFCFVIFFRALNSCCK